MKKRYSTMVNTHKSDKPKKAFLQSNNTYMALFGSVLLSLLLISACSPETFSEQGSLRAEDSATDPDRHMGLQF